MNSMLISMKGLGSCDFHAYVGYPENEMEDCQHVGINMLCEFIEEKIPPSERLVFPIVLVTIDLNGEAVAIITEILDKLDTTKETLDKFKLSKEKYKFAIFGRKHSDPDNDKLMDLH